MEDHLNVTLPEGWSRHTEEVFAGLTTFMKDTGPMTGVLQLSYRLYRGGPAPNPSERDLLAFAKSIGAQRRGEPAVRPYGEPETSESGPCALGSYGAAVFRTETFSHFQVWFLSNGKDFIIATYICANPPAAAEVAESAASQEIVRGVTLVAPGSADADA